MAMTVVQNLQNQENREMSFPAHLVVAKYQFVVQKFNFFSKPLFVVTNYRLLFKLQFSACSSHTMLKLEDEKKFLAIQTQF